MSSNNNNNNKQPLDLTDSLPVATGGLAMEDPVGPVNALKAEELQNQMEQYLGGFDVEDDEDGEDDKDNNDEIEEDDDDDEDDDDYDDEDGEDDKSQLKAIGGKDLDVLENLKPAVRKRVEVLKGIQSEHDELEAQFFEEKERYQKLYAPLYSKRYDIVTGAVEVDGAKEEDAMDQTNDTEKGVPEFWLTAMKHNEITAAKITERDEEALKYLKDIKWCRMDDPKDFKLEFFFDTNPFFTNSVLTKVYHMGIEHCYRNLIIEKEIGTTIDWLPGKCLTRKNLERSGFFDIIERRDEFRSWELGIIIRDMIIPHAVSWFTDEANQDNFGGFDDEGDEDDEDEEETKTKKKSQLKAIGGKDSDVLENLKPAVRKRVEVLRGIQSKHDELEAEYFEEKVKYQKRYAPLYSKRYDIVTGAVEVDGTKEEDAEDQTDDTEKGVPEFWLTAMKHNGLIHHYLPYTITERDEEALKYLKDIKWCHMDDPKGFKLEFFFDTNPFFTNSVLTKEYHMRSSFYCHKLKFEKAIGTTIDWLPGKCLPPKILNRYEDYASFFYFFTLEVSGDLDKRDEYYTGLCLRDKIIPHAVSWFTGEAKRSIPLGGFYDEDDEDYESDEHKYYSDYKKRSEPDKNLDIPEIKTQVAPRIPTQSDEASSTDVKSGKKNNSSDIAASSRNQGRKNDK